MDVTTDLAVAWLTFQRLCVDALRTEWAQVAMKFFPFVVIFELPVQAAVMLGARPLLAAAEPAGGADGVVSSAGILHHHLLFGRRRRPARRSSR